MDERAIATIISARRRRTSKQHVRIHHIESWTLQRRRLLWSALVLPRAKFMDYYRTKELDFFGTTRPSTGLQLWFGVDKLPMRS